MVGLLVVGAAVLVLLIASVISRRPTATGVDESTYLARWSALHGDLDVGRSALVRGWLRLVYRLARPLARGGAAPDLLTAWGLVAGGLAVALSDLGGRWPLAAALVVVASGLLDGLDGAVAVLADRVTAFGSVLDSVVDRAVDGLYLLALWRLGAPSGLCVAAGAAVALLEYTRARAGSAGMAEIGVVTVGERPTRVILTVVTLGCASAYAGSAGRVAGAGTLGVAVVSLVGLAQLLRVVRRRLR